MSRLIQKSGYIKPGKASGYMKYIATRERVEILKPDASSDEAQDRSGYLRYMGLRPRAERHGEHGLFSSGASVSMDAALHEVDAHEGNVWTLIYSLRRADAARLGYGNTGGDILIKVEFLNGKLVRLRFFNNLVKRFVDI